MHDGCVTMELKPVLRNREKHSYFLYFNCIIILLSLVGVDDYLHVTHASIVGGTESH